MVVRGAGWANLNPLLPMSPEWTSLGPGLGAG